MHVRYDPNVTFGVGRHRDMPMHEIPWKDLHETIHWYENATPKSHVHGAFERQYWLCRLEVFRRMRINRQLVWMKVLRKYNRLSRKQRRMLNGHA